MPFFGISDYQINGFLKKIGFTDIPPGYACEKGDTIVLKAGYFRLLISAPADKEQLVRVPSSMTDDDWTTLNRLRQNSRKTIFVFCSREYVHPSLLKTMGRNNLVPTEEAIRKKSSKEWKKDGQDDILVLRPTHMALISIRGVNFRLHDVNSFEGMRHKDNLWVQPFRDLMRDEAVPRIYKNFNLRKEDVNYEEIPCHFSMG